MAVAQNARYKPTFNQPANKTSVFHFCSTLPKDSCMKTKHCSAQFRFWAFDLFHTFQFFFFYFALFSNIDEKYVKFISFLELWNGFNRI